MSVGVQRPSEVREVGGRRRRRRRKVHSKQKGGGGRKDYGYFKASGVVIERNLADSGATVTLLS
jgi:hypothetical protein